MDLFALLLIVQYYFKNLNLIHTIQILFIILFTGNLGCRTPPVSAPIKQKNPYIFIPVKKDQYSSILLHLVGKSSGKEKQLRFLLDTGSNISLIKNGIFPGVEKTNINMKSLFHKGDRDVESINMDLIDPDTQKVIFGGVKVYSTYLPDNFMFDGILGNDILKNKIVLIHLPDGIYFLDSMDTIPFKGEKVLLDSILEKNHFYIQADIGSERMKLVFDTGAFSLVGQSKNLKDYTIGKKISLTDLNGELKIAHTIFFNQLCFFPKRECRQKPEFILLNKDMESKRNSVYNEGGIFGWNLMQFESYILDYSQKKIYLLKKD